MVSYVLVRRQKKFSTCFLVLRVGVAKRHRGDISSSPQKRTDRTKIGLQVWIKILDFLCFHIFLSPGHVGSESFYRIDKSFSWAILCAKSHKKSVLCIKWAKKFEKIQISKIDQK